MGLLTDIESTITDQEESKMDVETTLSQLKETETHALKQLYIKKLIIQVKKSPEQAKIPEDDMLLILTMIDQNDRDTRFNFCGQMLRVLQAQNPEEPLEDHPLFDTFTQALQSAAPQDSLLRELQASSLRTLITLTLINSDKHSDQFVPYIQSVLLYDQPKKKNPKENYQEQGQFLDQEELMKSKTLYDCLVELSHLFDDDCSTYVPIYQDIQKRPQDIKGYLVAILRLVQAGDQVKAERIVGLVKTRFG